MLSVCPYQTGQERYYRSVTKATVADLWGRITGKETNLVCFDMVAKRLHCHQQTVKGIQEVPLAQIVGSVGRASDFTRTFLPRARVACERWARIDALTNAQKPLPPVELYQIGEVYFVRDGHHRVSVARVNGWLEIEADVVELAAPAQLTVEDFQQERWITKIEQGRQEKTMYYVIDAELAKHELEERLLQAEQQRLCRQMMANQPKWEARIRQSLGDLLIAIGMRLKAHPQSGLVELA
jgi:hypothetical protein